MQAALISLIRERIIQDFSAEVALLVSHGLTAGGETGSAGGIYLLPAGGTWSTRAVVLGQSFRIDGTGYCLGMPDWDQLAAIAGLQTRQTSLLLDGRVEYAASPADRQRFEALQASARQRLADDVQRLALCRQLMHSARAGYFGLDQIDGQDALLRGVDILEQLLMVLATLNRTWVRRGLSGYREELAAWELQPPGFAAGLAESLWTCAGYVHWPAVQDLIRSTGDLVETVAKRHVATRATTGSGPATLPERLQQLYGQLAASYQLMRQACDRQDGAMALAGAARLDGLVREQLADPVVERIFPELLPAAQYPDFEHLRDETCHHEQVLLELCAYHGVPVRSYNSLDGFARDFGQSSKAGPQAAD